MNRSGRLTRALTTTAALSAAMTIVATTVGATTVGVTTEPPADDPVMVDDALVTAARAGLAGWLDVNRPPTPSSSTDLVGCPAIDADAYAELLGAHGIVVDPTDADWGTEIEWNEYEELSPEMIGIVCGGDTDGDTHDSTMSAAFGIFAVELPASVTTDDLLAWSGFPLEFIAGTDGDTASACDRSADTFCLGLWHRDGLVLGVTLINDAAPADDATMTAIVDATVPQLLATLAAAEPVVAPNAT